MSEYLNKNYGSNMSDLDFDPDYKHGCVWFKEEGAIVSWSVDEEEFVWDDQTMSRAGLAVEKEKAVEHTRRQ